MGFAVADQEKACIVGNLTPFVKIKRKGIRPRDTRQQGSNRLGKDTEGPKGAVDVEPQTFASAQSGKFAQWINRSGTYRAGGTRYKKWNVPYCLIAFDLALKIVKAHTMVGIRFDQPQGCRSKSRQIECLAQAAMGR
jgi:hypothetical protein